MESIKGLSTIHKLIAYILKKLDRELGAVELVKIVYLIDVEYFKLFGETLTGLNYIRQKLGPYTRDISNAVIDLEEREGEKIVETRLIPSKRHSSIPKRSHKLKKEVRFEPGLEPEEKEVINQVISAIESLTPKQLEKESYKTEPMKEIIEKEKRVKENLYGAPLDFSLIKRNEFMKQWLDNRKKIKDDLEYDQYLEEEKRTFVKRMAKL